MRIFSFAAEDGRKLEEYQSSGVRFARILRDVSTPASIGCMYLEPYGVIGRHPAHMDQLFLIVKGSGVVSGAGEKMVPVKAGRAVFWRQGEVHETRAGESGLVAIVIESVRLDPEQHMRLIA
jgi:mannose-6-phosphate isomerase-like protein (cupin superfamily)